MNQQDTVDSVATVLSANGSPKPPKITGTPGQTTTGVAGEHGSSVTASFNGVPHEEVSAVIQWNDGVTESTFGPVFLETEPVSASFNSQDQLVVTNDYDPNTVFAHPGKYIADIRIYQGADPGGRFLGQVRVPVAVTLNSPTGVTVTATADQAFSGSLGTFQWPLITASSPATEYLVIDWGDGEAASQGTYLFVAQTTDSSGDVVGVYTASGSHTYTRPGRYRVQVIQTPLPTPTTTTGLEPGQTPTDGATPTPTPSSTVIYDTIVVRKPRRD
jgi:hypothetical protein